MGSLKPQASEILEKKRETGRGATRGGRESLHWKRDNG